MKRNSKIHWMVIGAVICGLYVILGAFGAHGLEDKLTADQMATYETALRYLIIHALALILINFIGMQLTMKTAVFNSLVVSGMLLFSCSLLIHACKDLIGFDANVFALMAPIGGLAFVAAWFNLSYRLLKQ